MSAFTAGMRVDVILPLIDAQGHIPGASTRAPGYLMSMGDRGTGTVRLDSGEVIHVRAEQIGLPAR